MTYELYCPECGHKNDTGGMSSSGPFCHAWVGEFTCSNCKRIWVFGFATTGNRADWNECLGDLKAADADIQEIWAKLGLPNNPEDSPGHDKLVVAAAECARANRVEWM